MTDASAGSALQAGHCGASDAHILDRAVAACLAVTRPVAFLGVLGMLIVSGLTMVDVLSRWLAGQSIAATNEVISMTFAVAVSACIPAGLAQGVSLKVDILEFHLAERWKRWLVVIGNLLLIVFFGLLAWRIWIYAGELVGRSNVTIVLGWPVGPFMYAASALIALGVLVQIVVTANSLRRAIASLGAVERAQRTPLAVKAFLMITGVACMAIAVVALVDFSVLARFAQAHPGATVGIACLLLWAVLISYVPLAAVMGLIGIVGTALYIGFAPTMTVFATEITGFLTNSLVAVLPLFLMMGSFAAVAGIADDAYELAHAISGGFRGGLAFATIGGCAGFGAVSGSSMATAATIGRVALPQMKARGYEPSLASGCVAAGGTLGPLIPPTSGPLVLFALLTEASIGQLFVASVVPALIIITVYVATVLIYVRLKPASAPVSIERQKGELAAALKRSIPLAVMFICVLGGLYVGIFTVIESAAVGTFIAFLVALLRGKLHRTAFWRVMGETTAVTAMIYSLIFGALVFAYFTEITDLTRILTDILEGLHLQPLGLVTVLLVAFVILGTFLDSFAIMIATIPIVTPLVLGAGFDIVWWGIINLFVIEIGTISPPFGINIFVLKSVSDTPLAVIYRGVAPFCVAAIATLALLVLFPELSLWLPSTMFR